MLHSWMSGQHGRNFDLPYTFSDRSDLWPSAAAVSGSEMTDRSDYSSIADGLLAGTTVATELGWQAVEDLRAGERIVTFDNGMRPLKAVRVSTLWTAEKSAPRHVWPLEVPKGVLGNRSSIRLLPNQTVLIESDAAEALYGDPFTMVSAAVLDGHNGISRVPPARELVVVTLEFEGDEIVYANGTALVHCPNTREKKVSTVDELMISGSDGLYQRLTETQGRHLLKVMNAQG